MLTLFAEKIGFGQPVLALLHGQGANGAVFKPLLRELGDWPGQIVVPDLRGHGRSPHARHYAMAHHAADVADLFEPGTPIHVVGHSMGGAVALVLASGMFGITVERVTAFGVKVTWTADELAKAESFARSPVRWFDTRAEAAERFIRVGGLSGHAAPDDAVVDAGIREEGRRWRLATDNATVRAANLPAADMFAAVRAPFRLLRGARDPMMTLEDLQAYDAQTIEIADAAHNVHVEAPGELAGVIRKLHLG